MIDPAHVPEVDSQELLSRYVLSRKHVNQQTQLLKGDAFLPHPYEELSVTRHRDATDAELWSVGQQVATQRKKTLHGRGDAHAALYLDQALGVVAAPVDGNPNHVNVTGWPHNDKPAQMLIAKEIAAAAKFLPTPEA
jgi:hypothetical protein